MNNRRIRIFAAIAAVFLYVLLTLSSLAEGLFFDPEDGVWIESGEKAGEDRQSGYMTLLRGHVVYRDANRTDPIGYPTEESIVYATCVRTYEKGSVYQVRFDTQQTRNEEKCITGYYYTQYPRMEDKPEPSTDVRILDGVMIPLIRFHYGAETGVESQYNVVTASGTAYIAKGGTNLREGPGGSYNYVARLAKDTKVTITGFNINSNVTWYYVYDSEGNRGFVRADLLTDLPSTVIPTPEPTETATIIAGPEEAVSNDQLESSGETTELTDEGNAIASLNEEGIQNPETEEEVVSPENTTEGSSLIEVEGNNKDGKDTKDEEKQEDLEDEKDKIEQEDGKDPADGEVKEDEEISEDGETGESEEKPEDNKSSAGEEEKENEEKPEKSDGPESMNIPEVGNGLEDVDEKKIDETETVQREVHVTLRWENTGKAPAFGDRAVLTAQLSGYENTAYTLQWQTSHDGQNWSDVTGATMPSLALTMTEENYLDFWRVLVTAEVPK